MHDSEVHGIAESHNISLSIMVQFKLKDDDNVETTETHLSPHLYKYDSVYVSKWCKSVFFMHHFLSLFES